MGCLKLNKNKTVMTAKEKALELCVKFFKPSVFEYEEKQYLVDEENAKQSALICVDEILKSHYKVLVGVMPKVYDYWQEVKQEINKI